MKSHQRLIQSLKAIEERRGKIKLSDWLLRQPNSTRRGWRRGRFVLPSYVTYS